MAILFNDPYGQRKHSLLKGQKSDTFFKVVIEEGKFYKHDNAYILFGQFTIFMGINRSFGSGAIEPCLTELPIYGQEYEVRQKKPGTGGNGSKPEYESVKHQPSIAEALIYKHIEDNPSAYLDKDKALTGEITFYPDENYTAMGDDETKVNHVLNNFKFTQIEPSGKYPDWEAPKGQRGGGGYSKGVSIEEKETYLKKFLAKGCKKAEIKEATNLEVEGYVQVLLDDYKEDERFLSVYFDLAKALIS